MSSKSRPRKKKGLMTLIKEFSDSMNESTKSDETKRREREDKLQADQLKSTSFSKKIETDIETVANEINKLQKDIEKEEAKGPLSDKSSIVYITQLMDTKKAQINSYRRFQILLSKQKSVKEQQVLYTHMLETLTEQATLSAANISKYTPEVIKKLGIHIEQEQETQKITTDLVNSLVKGSGGMTEDEMKYQVDETLWEDLQGKLLDLPNSKQHLISVPTTRRGGSGNGDGPSNSSNCVKIDDLELMNRIKKL